MASFPGELRRLARDYGLQTTYRGVDGWVSARVEPLRAILDSLGVPTHNLEALRRARQERARVRARELIPPVVIVWDGRDLDVPLNQTDSGAVAARLELEDGTTRHVDLVDERRTARLQGALPLGYHRLWVSTARGEEHQARLIAAPRRAFDPKTTPRPGWGVFAPLYALHRQDGWGSGDFTDLRALVDWTSSLGGRAVGTLPLFACFHDEPFDPSPYSPISRRFWNEFFVDPRSCEEWQAAPEARRLVDDESFQRSLKSLRDSEWVDYRRSMGLKRSVLRELAAACARLPARREALHRRVAESPQLLEYARFRARVDETGCRWRGWAPSERGGRLDGPDARPASDEAIHYHLYVQWLAQTQLEAVAAHAATLDAGLYLDLPLGAHPDGYDVWREQSSFVLDASVGAPPDRLFRAGQDWGFPPLHPDEARRQGHRYWIECVRKQLQIGTLARIDHVMGLHRLYWIPSGGDKRDGVYMRYPAEEHYAILTLESHRNQCRLVGENLGIVPGYVNAALSRHRIRKTFVLQYELRQGDEPIAAPPRRAVVALNTHDTPTFAGFWQGTDIEAYHRLGLFDDDEVRRQRVARELLISALANYLQVLEPSPGSGECDRLVDSALEWLSRSRAGLVLVTLEDLWCESRPQNIPGSMAPVKNWQRKLRHSLDALSSEPEYAKRLRRLGHFGSSLDDRRS